jgi:hypothetical protein
MRVPAFQLKTWRIALIVLASFTVTIWHAFYRGQDFNWDQRNYHIGVPYLLSHGAFWNNIGPAEIQSYLNPYVIQAEYFGMTHLNAYVFVVILALVQSIAFIVAGLCCEEIVRSRSTATGALEATALVSLGFALCLLSPVALSEAGATFIDLSTAALVTGAFALLLMRERVGLWTASALAGGLIGVATALKLTNGVFAFGVIGFALAGPDTWSQRLRWLVLCGLAALLGFLAVGGSWHLGLWERFHNPFFPYYNNIFHSPDYTPTPMRDERFLPESFLDIWRYPLYWLFGGSPHPGMASPSTELRMGDARWVVLIFGFTVFLAALPLLSAWRRRVLAEPATGLLVAVVISYLVWLLAFGIHRYMVANEILCGVAILVLALQIDRPVWRLGALAGVAILAFAVMRVPDWGHVPMAGRWKAINEQPLDLGGPSLVFVTTKPSIYLVASLPPDARFVGSTGEFNLHADSGTVFTRQLKQALEASPALRLKAIDEGFVPKVAAAMLATYGLAVTANCQKLTVSNESFRICDVERRP